MRSFMYGWFVLPLALMAGACSSVYDSFPTTPYDVAVIGDYNIGGDAWASRTLLEEMGLRVVAQWSGDGTIAEIDLSHRAAELNLVQQLFYFLRNCFHFLIHRHLERRLPAPVTKPGTFDELRSTITDF